MTFLGRTMSTPPRLHVSAVSRPRRSELPAQALRTQLAEVIEADALALLDPARIEALAEDMRVTERSRVHHPGLVVGSLILSAFQQPSDTGGRWLDAQAVHRQIGGVRSSKTGYRNYVRKMVPVLRTLLKRRMKQLVEQTEGSELKGRLRQFSDVLVPDGCAFKLAACLLGVWPGTGTPAELKLHAVYSFRTDMADVSISAGRVHDNKGFAPKTWKKGALYIWDLGFDDIDRFVDAVLSEAIPLQRLKSNANPRVVAFYDENGERCEAVDGDGREMRLNDATLVFPAKTGAFEMDALLTDSKGRTVTARIVCVPHQGEDHYFMTMLPREAFTSFDVAELYRLRWEVELFFRSWHGALRMDAVHRLRHRQSILAHVYASLLGMTLVRGIHTGLERLQAQHDRETVGAAGRRTARTAKPAHELAISP